MALAPAPRAVLEELLFSHLAELDVPYATYRWHSRATKKDFYENLFVDELEFLFCPPGVKAEKGVDIDGRLSSTFEAIDAYAVMPTVAYFAQAKSIPDPFNAKEVSDWFVKVSSFVSRERLFGSVSSTTERVAIYAVPRYVGRGVNAVTEESLTRIRDGNRSWTLLLFHIKQRGRMRIFTPFDDWTLRWTWARLQQSPRALASLHAMRNRVSILHRELTDAAMDSVGNAAAAAAAAVRAAAGAAASAAANKVAAAAAGAEAAAVAEATAAASAPKRVRTEDDVPCHETGKLALRSHCVQCTVAKCGKWFKDTHVVNKFKSSVEAIRATPAWTCWHCEDVCTLHSCVAKREGGMKATDIVALLGTEKRYYEWLMEARALGYASVQAMAFTRFQDKSWVTPV